MANLFHRTGQKTTVLSQLPLSGPLAKTVVPNPFNHPHP